MKKVNYKVGALKRKFGVKGDFEPGTLISKVNENKALLKEVKPPLSKKQVAIMGMV